MVCCAAAMRQTNPRLSPVEVENPFDVEGLFTVEVESPLRHEPHVSDPHAESCGRMVMTNRPKQHDAANP